MLRAVEIDPAQATDLVHRYFDAWNHMDVPSIAGFFAHNGVYFDVPADEEYRGKALTGYLSSYLAENDNRTHYDLAGEVLIGPSTVAFKYRAYDADGHHQAEPRAGAEFLVLLGDKVARLDDYYETRPVSDPVTAPPPVGPKYVKSGLNEVTSEHYRNRLLKLMNEDNVYLQPDLSLPGLAGMVRCSVNHLSQVINVEFGSSFFEFLNQHRIADARKMLASDPKCHALDVALQVGFNSNSTFYSAFKKICKVTPAEYRRRAHGL